ncbi:hypothetical protein [Dietzia lutea]|uniref:DUF1795 domain-containing protein n=1 Tax=Dietzia lutea TaxID=546160 RepID=A0A2S1R6I0_9ACTN|nr:hypothetical protein [Dietzia lutea]AWH91896.1 hypothetical protein A6035_06675 [Dietzia lutea]
MTSLFEFLDAGDRILEPLDDASLAQLDPGPGWRLVEQTAPVDNVAIWGHPGLYREGFQPTVIISLARVTPAVDRDTLLDRLADTAATLERWRVRATDRVEDGRGHLVSDTLGEFRVGPHELTASTLASVWQESGATVLRQVVVTTFTDQVTTHSGVLRALG